MCTSLYLFIGNGRLMIRSRTPAFSSHAAMYISLVCKCIGIVVRSSNTGALICNWAVRTPIILEHSYLVSIGIF